SKINDGTMTNGLTPADNRIKEITDGTGDVKIGLDAALCDRTNSDEAWSQKFIDNIKKKPVYTVGESTADALEPYGILARFPDDYNATTLSKMMLMDGVHTRIIHFCGDVRRRELGMAMKDAGIEVYEVIVYKKQEVNDSGFVNSTPFDGVVFYSPSAVHAFFGQHLNENYQGKWFAIGQTTAAALRELGIEPLVPRAPTSELMIEFIAKHFKTVN
ncbi:MAG TPA: hypothetical protein DCE78_04785, partial [Bacteroidetes bacterium]|nr:hypothetical protein [Bacteroidota bacterium]